jgi:hypothetical protein
VKGKPFNPDAHSRAILDKAAMTAWKMSKVEAYENTPTWAKSHTYPDRQWLDPNLDFTLDLDWMRPAENYRDLPARIAYFSTYYAVSAAMASRTPGQGAIYLIGFSDADGDALHGGTAYRLHLPKDIPTDRFWSLTVYDAWTAAGLDNGQPFPSLGLRDKPMVNDDGSMDLYLGPTAPPGKEKNWLKTVPGKGYFTIFRLYAPAAAALDKTWKPSDLEKVKTQ